MGARGMWSPFANARIKMINKQLSKLDKQINGIRREAKEKAFNAAIKVKEEQKKWRENSKIFKNDPLSKIDGKLINLTRKTAKAESLADANYGKLRKEQKRLQAELNALKHGQGAMF